MHSNTHSAPPPHTHTYTHPHPLSPEHDEALRLTHALQDGSILWLGLQHGLKAQEHLLNSLQELTLVGVTAGHLAQHVLGAAAGGNGRGEGWEAGERVEQL